MSSLVHSYQITESIDLKQFKTAFTAVIYQADNDELFYEIEEDKLLYVFKYGIVCFYNYNETEMTSFIQLIKPYCKNLLDERLSEEFEIETNSARMKFGENRH